VLDLRAFAAGCVVLVFVATAAAIVPIRRAGSIDPASRLRSE
jgi:ABC-type lipoprotein release transport system permease subunit